MLGELSKNQIEHVLQAQIFGRLGCYANGKMYVVPITYAYDGRCLYAHSRVGMKVNMMRKNPEVCFQVDIVDNMANWRSVIAWGKFEELKSESDRKAGLKILTERFAPFMSSDTAKPPHGMEQAPHVVEKGMKALIFRVKLKEKTGRFEKS